MYNICKYEILAGGDCQTAKFSIRYEHTFIKVKCDIYGHIKVRLSSPSKSPSCRGEGEMRWGGGRLRGERERERERGGEREGEREGGREKEREGERGREGEREGARERDLHCIHILYMYHSTTKLSHTSS